MTVLPDSRLVAQTMRLRAPAWACRNSCPYTLGRKCSGSAAHSLWSSDSAVETCCWRWRSDQGVEFCVESYRRPPLCWSLGQLAL